MVWSRKRCLEINNAFGEHTKTGFDGTTTSFRSRRLQYFFAPPPLEVFCS